MLLTPPSLSINCLELLVVLLGLLPPKDPPCELIPPIDPPLLFGPEIPPAPPGEPPARGEAKPPMPPELAPIEIPPAPLFPLVPVRLLLCRPVTAPLLP
jgi:hypothetical protein